MPSRQLSHRQLAVILEELVDGVTVMNSDGQLIYANDAAAKLLGYLDAHTFLARPADETLRQFEIFDEAGQPLPIEDLPSRRALRGLSEPPRTIRFRVRPTGQERWSLVKAQPVFAPDGTLELVVSIFREITDLKRSEIGQRLLAESGMELSTPLDFETRLVQMAHLVVPDLADWCIVDVVEVDGTLRRLAVAQADPAKVELAQELHRHYPSRPDKSGGIYSVMRSSKSLFHPELSESELEASFPESEQRLLTSQLHIKSLMIVPLVARQRTLGTLTIMAAESGRRYTPIDLALAEDLARRAALALDNALLYAHSQRLNAELEKRVTARALQIEAAYARLKDEISERRQAEEQIRLLNTELEARVLERTKQLEQLNRSLQYGIRQRQQTSKTLRAVLRRTRELYRISQTIGTARTPDEILAALLTSSYLNTISRASIALFTGSIDGLQPPQCEILAAWNKDVDLPGFVGECLTLEEVGLLPPYQPNKPIVIENVQLKRGFAPSVRRRFALLKTRGLIIFPLIAGGVWYGVLSLHFRLRRAIKVEDLRHMRGLVNQLAIAIDNIRLLAAEAQARRQAEEANDLKLKFLAMISHELRTPLTSIKGFATTLLADDIHWHPSNQRDFLLTIDEETDRLSDLIEQLLDLSRLEAGTLRIAPQSQTLERVIDKALVQLQTMTSDHYLVLNVPTDLPPVYADAERIGQVLTNIVGNAARYAPPQTVITLTAQRVDRTVQIDVLDEGPGIPASARARIFEPFEQVDRPATNNRTGGAGLGLAICKGLVEAHGGRIWIQDRAEPGTKISFTVPLAEEQTTS